MKKSKKPAQKQEKQPGIEYKMNPQPDFLSAHYKGSDKLKNKIAIITGGDSGIGRAVAILFAIEGADVVIAYLNEHEDAKYTKQFIEGLGRKWLLIAADLRKIRNCEKVITKTIDKFNRIDVLVNNVAEQHPQEDFKDITEKQLIKTFKTNVFSYFYMIRAALSHMKKAVVLLIQLQLLLIKAVII